MRLQTTVVAALYGRWQSFFQHHDNILAPAITISPRSWRELYPAEIDGKPTRTYFHWLAMAYAVTIVGHPAISLPVGVDRNGMPFGLQIIGPDGGWHDVSPTPGAFLVNLGDLTAEWTNVRWRSTVHRVLPPARLPDRVNHRRSVAFFHDGNHDARIECLPTCTSADNPAKYAPVLAGDHLMAKLMGPRLLTESLAQQTTGDRLG